MYGLGIAVCVFWVTPALLVLIWKESSTIRQIAYVWQWVAMAALISVQVWSVIAIEADDLPEFYCAQDYFFTKGHETDRNAVNCSGTETSPNQGSRVLIFFLQIWQISQFVDFFIFFLGFLLKMFFNVL